MKKIIFLSLVCSGFIATTPHPANALNPQPHSQNLSSKSQPMLAQYRRDRRFSVYYRSSGYQQWTLDRAYPNRREAEAAARRLARRGYRTYVQLSRRV
jgi:hypothetical protein